MRDVVTQRRIIVYTVCIRDNESVCKDSNKSLREWLSTCFWIVSGPLGFDTGHCAVLI